MEGLSSYTVYEKNLQERKRDAWSNLKDSEKRLERDQEAYSSVLREEASFERETGRTLNREIL